MRESRNQIFRRGRRVSGEIKNNWPGPSRPKASVLPRLNAITFGLNRCGVD
jgi:hypothetical protein